MTVEELTEKLTKLDPKLQVVCDDKHGGCYPVIALRSVRYRSPQKDCAVIVFDSKDVD